ncbi:mfs amine [Moniliophthora roreri MCA 2997]|uniref:Mfs amine n=1 Tax=Moniliophthora roreri (strain MCA 2997) TaxID=1381753 RepID=V2XKT8_MONRO|nr:mfs amine [Moniliophthora roreri MCA 2997]
MGLFSASDQAPVGLRWRAGYVYVTFVVWLGIAVDLLVYSIVVPVMPFQLEKLGYNNVSSLTGWLLFSYSAGLAITTFPVAMLSERYNARQWPLVLGIFLLIGSIIMLMEASVFWLMVVARALQGVGSTMVWVVGLALLCDTTPERITGRQLGFAMSGMSIGFLLGPPVGGAIYDHFGFRGVCIFGICGAVIDLIARFVVIERKHALEWGFDPQSVILPENPENNLSSTDVQEDEDIPRSQEPKEGDTTATEERDRRASIRSREVAENARVPNEEEKASSGDGFVAPELSLLAVVIKLLKSSRAMATVACLFVYGAVHTAFEPALPVHMNHVWDFDSAKVGLVFVAAVVPTFPSSAIAGHLTDKFGAPPIAATSLILSIPWWCLLSIDKLGLFITSFALEFFFLNATLAPLTAELADVARHIEGIGYAHVYAAFNLAYGIGATVGPVMGGQIYDGVEDGWLALCFVNVGWIFVGGIIGFFFIGERPLSVRLTGLFQEMKRPSTFPSNATVVRQ